MATLYTLQIAAPDLEQPVISGARHLSAIKLAKLFTKLASGHQNGVTLIARNSAVKASATVTCASVQAADTVVVRGVTFTAANGSPTSAEFDMSGTNTACGASLAAAINANTTLDGIVLASAASGVVTITALQPGELGNAVTLTTSNGTRLAATGSGRLASGAETVVTLSY